jgi:ubiquinone/menaquinone biosynthesis C-methylase UbiE
MAGYRERILDIGCGTSKILAAFPQAIGLDISYNKLRYNLSLGNELINADLKDICFKDESFDTVICSEVIEHIEKDYGIFQEMTRIIKSDGVLILGTPDYSTFSWNLIEWFYKRIIPGGYGDEHITRYNKEELVRLMESVGFKLESRKYILGAELICKFVRAF